jgi:hypothetical protein
MLPFFFLLIFLFVVHKLSLRFVYNYLPKLLYFFLKFSYIQTNNNKKTKQ